eukprot:6640053-Karenia_brevis.AAC.1
MNVAIAWSCGWKYTWLMLVVLIGGQVVQAWAAQSANPSGGGARMVLTGVLPDALMFGAEWT